MDATAHRGDPNKRAGCRRLFRRAPGTLWVPAAPVDPVAKRPLRFGCGKEAETSTLDTATEPKPRAHPGPFAAPRPDSEVLTLTSAQASLAGACPGPHRRRSTRKKYLSFQLFERIRHEGHGRLPSWGDSSMRVRVQLRHAVSRCVCERCFSLSPPPRSRVGAARYGGRADSAIEERPLRGHAEVLRIPRMASALSGGRRPPMGGLSTAIDWLAE